MVKMKKDTPIPPAKQPQRTPQPRALHALCHAMTAFVHQAEDATTSLYALSYHCCSLFGSGALQRDIASRFMAAAGAVTFLRGFLADDKHGLPLLSPRDLESIADNMLACESVMMTVTTAMQALDEYLQSEAHITKSGVPAKFNAFRKGEEGEALGILTRCCDVVIRATMIARREELGRRKALEGDEKREFEHLEHPRIKEAMACLEIFPVETKNTSSIQAGVPEATSGHKEKDDGSNLTIGSTQKATLTVTPSTDRGQAGTASGTGTRHTDDIADRLSTFTLSSDQHLEAYILRPHTELSTFGFSLSLKPEALHLDEKSVLAHMKNSDSTTSVVDAVCKLHPVQVWLMNEHTRMRGGQLVSMRSTQAVEVVTPMGALKVEPVMFIVKVTTTNTGATHDGRQTLSHLFPHGIGGPDFKKPAYEVATAQSTSYLVESSDCPPGSVQGYQSITTLPPYQDQSFEELRLYDYAHGAGHGYGRVSTLPGSIHGLFGAQPGAKSHAQYSRDAKPRVRVGAFENPKFPDVPTSGGSLFGGSKPAPGVQNHGFSSLSSSRSGETMGQSGLFAMVPPTAKPAFPSSGHLPNPFASTPSPQANTHSPDGNAGTTTTLFGHTSSPKPSGALFIGIQAQSLPFGTPASTNTGGPFGPVSSQPKEVVQYSCWGPAATASPFAHLGTMNHATGPSLFGASNSTSTSPFGNVNSGHSKPSIFSSPVSSPSVFQKDNIISATNSTDPSTTQNVPGTSRGKGQVPICRKCETGLGSHLRAEQVARMCGACERTDDMECWLCERGVRERRADGIVDSDGEDV